MGANLSQRPGKCLKNRRTKSEEYLDTKRNSKNSMGRFSTRWHDIISENIVNSHQENVNHRGIFECTDWTDDKHFSRDADMEKEKSFKAIHRSNSLDKSSFGTDYENLVVDYSHDATNVQQLSSTKSCNRRLTIDVNKDAIFEVNLHKGSRGLGFSVLEYDGFIFIKQLFPLEAASQCGVLQEGDIILSANGNTLADLSNFEALQILRKLNNPVTLIVCRLQQFSNKKSTTSSQNYYFPPAINGNSQYKEFEINMKKINGSLGFTLKKDEDNGHRNHIVRALVKNPAISDGRIKPGDQIISVNGQEICEMSHQEAVKFLRECDDEVVLNLRRDTLSSSLTSLSSSHLEDNNRTLRKEAVDMLNTLAVKKMKADCEDKQNNNSAHEADLQSISSVQSASHLKRKDMFFDSSENLPALMVEERHAVPTFVQNEDPSSDDLETLTDGPVSLPALDVTGDKINFHHNEPAYRSVNVPNFALRNSSEDGYSQSRLSPVPQLDNKGLLKWKGIVLDAEDRNSSQRGGASDESVVVQLQRNWNSRLGFSLSHRNGVTVISAIHPDSVAFNDSRLKVDDTIIEVNGKDMKNRETSEIIDMLRTVRGTVTIKVSRKNLRNQ